jgi:TfoX/Sxy family transcriptional regulator of competence genes
MPDMPKFTKSSDSIVDRFAAVMDGFPAVERRKMFGYPAAFVGGNMATGLFHDDWIVRLPKPEITAALDHGATPFEPVPGRPMTGFVVLPTTIVDDDAEIAAWVRKGVDHAAGMPRKESGGRKKKA